MINFKKSMLLGPLLFLSTAAFGQEALEKAPVPPKPQSGEPMEVKRQSGIGSNFAFSEAGVVELGGSLGYTSAEKYTEANISPSIGYFIANNVQFSLLGNVSYVKIDGQKQRNVGSLILEPSYHIPLTNTNFVFLGVGAGALFEYKEKTGTAIAPRLGYKTLVGRSGMLTFAFQPIFGLNEADVQTSQGTVLTVKQANNVQVGYTVLL